MILKRSRIIMLSRKRPMILTPIDIFPHNILTILLFCNQYFSSFRTQHFILTDVDNLSITATTLNIVSDRHQLLTPQRQHIRGKTTINISVESISFIDSCQYMLLITEPYDVDPRSNMISLQTRSFLSNLSTNKPEIVLLLLLLRFRYYCCYGVQ